MDSHQSSIPLDDKLLIRCVTQNNRLKIKREGERKVFCSPSYELPNPRRLTSATPIRGISRFGAVPSGLGGQCIFL